MKTITIMIFITVITIISSTVHAADSSPSAAVKTKLDALKAEIASKAAKLKQEVNKKLQNKAYVGVLKHKSDNSLTLASRSGSKIITLNQDTAFEGSGKAKFSFKTLKEDDRVAALGDIDDTGVMIAKRVIQLSATESESKSILWGQIISISDKLITIKTKELKNIAIAIDSKTEVPEKLISSGFVITSGKMNKNNILEVSLIYLIPQGGVILKPKVSTKSASPSTPHQ